MGECKNYEQDRGFGFLIAEEGQLEVFFHYTGYYYDAFDSLDMIGKKVVFSLGTSPKRSTEIHAAQWIFMDDVIWPNNKPPTTQDEYNQLRSQYFEETYPTLTNDLFKNEWYDYTWRNNKSNQPQNLKDKLLQDFLLTHLGNISNEKYKKIESTLKASPYEFAVNWSERGYDAIVAEFESCLDEGQLNTMALSVDLETDGTKIWQIGYATNQQTNLIFDGVRNDDVLSNALKELQDKISQHKLLVGHNIMAWDWPVLQKNLAKQSTQPVMWDTLLIDFLLDPTKKSYALNGQHNADSDAKDALAIFNQQLQKFSAGLKTQILREEFKTTHQLIGVLVEKALAVEWPSPVVPTWLTEGLLCVPNNLLSQLNWLPNTDIIDVADTLASKWQTINIDAVIQKHHNIKTTAWLVVAAVLKKAQQKHISVRLAMIPHWLSEMLIEEGINLADYLICPKLTAKNIIYPYPKTQKAYKDIKEQKDIKWLKHKEADCIVLDSEKVASDTLPNELKHIPLPTSFIYH